VHDLARGEIKDADAVVSQFGDEQPLAREVDRHVIDPAGHVAQRNLGLEPQCLLDRFAGRSARSRRQCQEKS
jgi:hypothetical protein